MDLKENIKSGFAVAADTISEIASQIAQKNRLRAQLNRLKQIIKGDSEKRDQAYIELGRYYYENLRENSNDDNKELCELIDKVSDRIGRASVKYLELLNENNNIKIKSENAEKIKAAIAKKAEELSDKAKASSKDIAQKTKEKASDIAQTAKEKACDVVEKAKFAAEDLKDKAVDTAQQIKGKVSSDSDEEIEKIIEEAADKAENIEKVEDDKTVGNIQAPQNIKESISDCAKEESEESPESFSF